MVHALLDANEDDVAIDDNNTAGKLVPRVAHRLLPQVEFGPTIPGMIARMTRIWWIGGRRGLQFYSWAAKNHGYIQDIKEVG